MLYKSGVYALKATCLTPGGLPYAIASRLRLIARLRGEQSTLTVWQKSAEGIVMAGLPEGKDEILWHFRETREQNGENKHCPSATGSQSMKARTVSPNIGD